MINILSEFNATKTIYEVKKLYPFIVQIGTGGTGGYILQNLAQMLGTTGIQHTYVVADPDIIEEKNLKNQLFLQDEIGLKKADVLASRYSDAYSIDIGSFSECYIESVEALMSLFNREYMQSISSETKLIPILISAVDNNYSRQIMDSFFNTVKDSVYIDAGNEATNVPSDWQSRPKSDWTKEELEAFNNSGWSGQVVTGLKLNGEVIMTPVAQEFPDILTDMDSIKPSGLSCSEISASEPQRLIVNKFSALAVTNIINEIIDNQGISNHITFFHSKKGYMRSIPYKETENA